MYRRSVLGVAAGVLAGIAGCSAIGDGGGESEARTVAPNLQGTPTATATPTATPTPYAPEDADRLARPRDVLLTNQRLDDARVAVRIRDGETGVLETTETVPGAGETVLRDVIGGVGTYDVRVRAADGRAASFAWAVDPGTGDLGVDLDPGVTIRDRYRGAAAADLVEGDTAALVDGPGRNTHSIVVDNPGSARRVEFAMANDEGFAGLQVRVPADARVALPLTIRSRAVSVVARVGESERTYEWRPLADGALYVAAADGPEFLCDLLWRDLRVYNGTDDSRRVEVNVTGNGREQFDGEFRLGGEERAVRRAVVAPAGEYAVEVAAGDRTERYEWDVCPPVGPVEVWVDSEGIDVSVTPTRPAGT